MTTLTQKREAVKAKRTEYLGVHEAAGADLDHTAKDVSKLAGRTFEGGGQLAEYLRDGFKEVEALQTEVNKLDSIDKSAREAKAALGVVEEGLKHAPPADTKDSSDELGLKGYTGSDLATYKGQTAGEVIVKAMLAKGGGDINESRGREFVIDMPTKMLEAMLTKTDMTAAAGWDPESIRIPGMVPYPSRPAPVAVNIIPTFPTTMDTITYMLESTYTNNAAEVSENSTIAESALAYTPTTSAVRKIGTSLPVTVEQLEDVPGLRAIIDQRIGFQVAQRLDLQVLVGDGSSPNISGFHDRTSINATAKGSTSIVVALHKAMTQAEVTGFANPDNYVLHPNDWQNIRLSQTSDGAFLFGPPSMAIAKILWGLPVTTTTAQTSGQGLVGDFANFSALYMRRGLTLNVTDSHASEFLDDIIRIKATVRAALAVFRESAFSEATGLAG